MSRARMGALLPVLLLAPAARADAEAPALVEIPPGTLPALQPILARGEVAVIESKRDGTMRQVAVIGLFNAPLARVWQTLHETERYTEFVPNLVKSHTRERTGEGDRDTRVVEWELEIPLKNVTGVNRYQFSGPDTVRITSIGGSTSVWLWRLHPVGDRTIGVLHGYVDVARLSWVLRTLIQSNKKAEHGIMVSAAIAFVKASQIRAESLAGRGSGKRPTLREAPPVALASLRDGRRDRGRASDLTSLGPLLSRGEVALIESHPDGRLRQAVLMARFHTARERAYGVAADVGAYDEFIPGVKDARVLSRNGDSLIYEFTIDAPFFDFRYRCRSVHGQDWLRSEAISGDLENAHTRWEFVELDPRRTLVLHHVNADVRRNSWLLRQLINVEPYYEHGVNVATALLTISHVRGKAEGWLRPVR